MRDAANLAWKFDLVLRGLAGEQLLDSCEAERKPHARKLMLDARAPGLVANTANPVKAAVRDLLFKFKLTPKPQFPSLATGILARGANGKPAGATGTLPPQGRLTVDGQAMRFDEHVGFNFSLVAKPGALAHLPRPLRQSWEKFGISFVELADGGASQPGQVMDTDGIYTRYLTSIKADAMLVRPDFVLFGAANEAGVVGLANDLLAQLRGGGT